MEVFVLVSQEHVVHGVFSTHEKAESLVLAILRAEGIPEDELEDYACEWSIRPHELDVD